MILAAQEGHDDVITALIEAGADVNIATTDDYSTALLCASQEDHPAIVDKLAVRAPHLVRALFVSIRLLWLCAVCGRALFVVPVASARGRLLPV